MDPRELPWLFVGAGMPGMDGRGGADASQFMRDVAVVMRRRHDDGELTSQQIEEIIAGLPRLSEEDLEACGQYDATCPICMNTYLAALAEEEMGLAMDSPAHATENLGVTRLAKTCGHVFCRKDLLTWIRDGHPSCPLCRTAFIKTPELSNQQQASTLARANDNAPDDDVPADDAGGEREYAQAMERIIAAYRDERSRMRSGPDSGLFWPDPSVDAARQDESEDADVDAREYAGMYS